MAADNTGKAHNNVSPVSPILRLLPLRLLPLLLCLTALPVAVPSAEARPKPRQGVDRLPRQTTDAGPVAETSVGVLRGIRRTRYDAWLGVPYAQPPVGKMRWRAPQPLGRYAGGRDAKRFGARCAQGTGWDPGYSSSFFAEDCLYLNVYVPRDAPAGVDPSRRPVMVWFHGGGYTRGAGQDTDPRRYVTATGVVHVTINYRLGALGFLNLPQLRSEGGGGPGNYGLLDQQAALRWVQANIGAFGGDPGNVTIAGQSAGGTSVCAQLASPAARGLFHRAIIHSGVCALRSRAEADAAGARFAEKIGCAEATALTTCLRQKTPREIVEAQLAVPLWPSYGDSSFPVDSYTAIVEGRINRVPVMAGQVENESSLATFHDNDFMGKPVTPEAFDQTIRDTYGSHANKVLEAYALESQPSASAALARVRSDVEAYVHVRSMRHLVRWTRVYTYELQETATPRSSSVFRLQWRGELDRSFPFGATHGDDLPYLWEEHGATVPFNDDQLELSDQIVAYWSAFQLRADPNTPYVPAWPPFSAAEKWMSLSACRTAESGSEAPAACSVAKDSAALSDYHRLDLWRSIFG